MGDRSQIEWTDATWNPTRGCSKVSEGCRNCYAMRQAIRQTGPGRAYEGLVHTVPGKGPQWTGRIRTVPEALRLPLRWRKPRRVFVDSMSDLFHPDVPFEFIDQVWAVMSLAPRHTFQILTKRPERAAEVMGQLAYRNRPPDGSRWPLPNVWIGTSVENQAAADERIPRLLRTPAAVRFLSCEPLLGPVDLTRIKVTASCYANALGGKDVVDWVIAGGESGPGARPCHVAWLRDLKNQCARAGVPFFLKQLGRFPYLEHLQKTITPTDRKGGDITCWPEDLRVREFPVEVAR